MTEDEPLAAALDELLKAKHALQATKGIVREQLGTWILEGKLHPGDAQRLLRQIGATPL